MAVPQWGRRTPEVAERPRAGAWDPAVRSYADEITLCPTWRRITRRARQLLEPGAAVVLDTETTDLYGQTIELAVVDAATGKVLQDTHPLTA
ncbi:hypothetical protein [Streptomyces lavendulocolor]|uniref:hypothetical protein n=1 Tax=Streptomyces lavendulocolor TaxID=67316 RepID=UPI003C2E5811